MFHYESRVHRMGIEASIKISGDKIPLNGFMNDFVGGTVIGVVETLQDVNPGWKLINLFVDRVLNIGKYIAFKTIIKIDGEPIPVGGFVNDAIGRIVRALLESLKGVEPDWKIVEIDIKRKYI